MYQLRLKLRPIGLMSRVGRLVYEITVSTTEIIKETPFRFPSQEYKQSTPTVNLFRFPFCDFVSNRIIYDVLKGGT